MQENRFHPTPEFDPAMPASRPASRQDLFDKLDALGIPHTTVEHEPLHTVEESRHLRGEIPGVHCKNLFLKDKKGKIYLVVVPEERSVPIQVLAKAIGAARLSFGKPELMEEVLGVTPGSVTPFALMNDTDGRVTVVLDQWMMEQTTLNYHPLKNDATTSLPAAGLRKFIEDCGHRPLTVDFANLQLKE